MKKITRLPGGGSGASDKRRVREAVASPKGGKSAPRVQYVLKGTLSAYTAYDSATSTDGSITIAVRHSNYHGSLLKNQSLTFTLAANSKVTFRHKSTLATRRRPQRA